MLCVLSLAIASVLHVANDFRANSFDLGQIAVSNAPNDVGDESGKAAESCHSCSVASYFSAAPSVFVASISSGVPEGRLIQVSDVSRRIAGPPPKN